MAQRKQGSAPASSPQREGWWTGDVWRTALLLKRRRPDLAITVLDAAPTGLALITNLDPANDELRKGYAEAVKEMMTWELGAMQLRGLFEELGVESTDHVKNEDQISSRFWF